MGRTSSGSSSCTRMKRILLAAACLAASASSATAHRSLLAAAAEHTSHDHARAEVDGPLTMNDPGVLETVRAFIHSRARTIHPNLHALLEAASFAASTAMPADQKDAMFSKMGHIGQVKDEVSFYAHAAHLRDVHLIGEIGFNAGHSAITMLFQTHHSRLVSFDTEDLPWSKTSLEFVQRLYPGRVERIKGNSLETVPQFAAKDPRKFDLFAVDGMHDGVFPYQDMAAGRNASRAGGYILIDDHSPSFPAVIEAWEKAKKEGWITEIICVDQGVEVDGYKKAYCLGQYAS